MLIFIQDFTTISNLKIAVLSGKGGTGKTLVSVNLAAVAKDSVYIDCDVEEPNGHLFFKPNVEMTKSIFVKTPVADKDLCTGCRTCVDFCNFNALAYVYDRLLVFNDVCHSCGGCALVCPNNAIKEIDKEVGTVEIGNSKDVLVATGTLKVGEASGIPIINELFELTKNSSKTTFIDCPPGSACIVMESIKDADFCVLVAEPTIFGVHNLSMVHELVELFNKPYGVILNKSLVGDNPAKDYCIKNNINVIGEIPFDKELGDINSNGLISVRESVKYNKLFETIYNNLLKEVQHETVVNP